MSETESVTFFPITDSRLKVVLAISVFEDLKKSLCEKMQEKLIESYRRRYGEWSLSGCENTDDIHRHASHSYAKLFLLVKPIKPAKGLFDNLPIDGLKKFVDIEPSKRFFLSPGDCFDVCSMLMHFFPINETVHSLMEVFDYCVTNKTRLAVELTSKTKIEDVSSF